MQRTKKLEKDSGFGLMRFQKLGGGTFHLKDGRRIKPMQVFEAAWEAIPDSFRDVVKVLEKGDTTNKPKMVENFSVPVYTMAHIGAGWYNVVNAQGKAINEKKLRKADAEEMLEKL